MYEAPDRYKRMIAARLPDGDSLALAKDADKTSSPLKDVQLMARGQLAPFFAAANVLAALLFGLALWGSAATHLLIGWTAVIGGANYGCMRWAQGQAVKCVGRSGRAVPQWLMVADVTARALLWLSLPVYLIGNLQPADQVVAGSIIAALGAAGLGLVVVPACAMAWIR